MIARLAVVCLLPVTAAAQNNVPVSVSSSGALANNNSYYSLISADGRYVVWQCEASNLATNDFNCQYDIYRRDLQAGVTELVSVSTGRRGRERSRPEPRALRRTVAGSSGRATRRT